MTTTLDSLNFYIESIRQMEEKGYLLDGEAEKLKAEYSISMECLLD